MGQTIEANPILLQQHKAARVSAWLPYRLNKRGQVPCPVCGVGMVELKPKVHAWTNPELACRYFLCERSGVAFFGDAEEISFVSYSQGVLNLEMDEKQKQNWDAMFCIRAGGAGREPRIPAPYLGGPHEELLPFLNRKVRTPRGEGTLVQVFASRDSVDWSACENGSLRRYAVRAKGIAVILDAEPDKVAYFEACEIEPVSFLGPGFACSGEPAGAKP
jgi:hypothetical protein